MNVISISFALQCAATVGTLGSTWLMGNKTLAGPLTGILAQVPWTGLIVHDGLWGLAPITMAMAAIHVRNFIKWRRASSLPSALAATK